jgi:hypothetical protein
MKTWLQTSLRFEGWPVHYDISTGQVAREDVCAPLVSLPVEVETDYRSQAEEELREILSARGAEAFRGNFSAIH